MNEMCVMKIVGSEDDEDKEKKFDFNRLRL